MSGRHFLRVLGPTMVETDGQRRPVRGQAGAVACILASRHPESVASEVLAEALWPDRPPSDSRSGLRVVVHRLRQLLGGANSVVNENDGYRLALAAEDVDQTAFEAAASSDDSASIDRALQLWRGRAYEPFDDQELLVGPATRLASLRLDLEERLVESFLDEGLDDLAAMRASVLVDVEPYRERRWELLMLALYRTGRQREALDAATQARTRLRDDLGIEPGPALVELEQDILQQRASLVARTAPSSSGPAQAGSTGVAGLGDLVADLRGLRSDVPAAVGSFLGRDADLARVESMLDVDRCVTIVGPPGAGKTRLAQQVCAEYIDRRVVWLDLVGATIDTIVERLAAALGLVADAGIARQLVVELSREPVLLVFDNAEHLVQAVAELAEALLPACDTLSLLVTSRARLGGSFERVCELGPLPDDAAATLLFQRAFGDAAGSAAWSRDDLADAVRRVDCFPLHIELLAPLLRGRSLDAALDAFGGSPADTADDRHASLDAAIDWSVRVLSPSARSLHAALSVFEGPVEVDDVVAVVDRNESDVRAGLDELDRHSLLRVDRQRPVPMYRQLAGVREHAQRELDDLGDRTRLEARHSSHFRSVAVDLGAALTGPNEPTAVARLERTMPQLELARRRLLESDDHQAVAELSTALAERMTLGLDHAHYWWLLQLAEWVDLDTFDDGPAWLSAAALVSWRANRPDLTETLTRRARAATGTGRLPIDYHLAIANTASYQGSSAESAQAFIDLWMASEEYGTAREKSTVAAMMTLGYVQIGDQDNASAVSQRSLRLARETGNPSSIAWATFAVGWAELVEDPAGATRSFLEALRIARTVRASWIEGQAIAATVTAALRRGRPVDACQLLPDVLTHFGRTQAVPQLARAGLEAVMALYDVGRSDLAVDMLARAELLAPVHPLLVDDQRRFDAIAEELAGLGRVATLDPSIDPADRWGEMIVLVEVANDGLRED